MSAGRTISMLSESLQQREGNVAAQPLTAREMEQLKSKELSPPRSPSFASVSSGSFASATSQDLQDALLRDTNPGEATALIMHVRVGMSDLGNPEGVGGRSGELADFLEDAPRNFKLHGDCCEDSPR